jgi:hypothetical protein
MWMSVRGNKNRRSWRAVDNKHFLSGLTHIFLLSQCHDKCWFESKYLTPVFYPNQIMLSRSISDFNYNFFSSLTLFFFYLIDITWYKNLKDLVFPFGVIKMFCFRKLKVTTNDLYHNNIESLLLLHVPLVIAWVHHFNYLNS